MSGLSKWKSNLLTLENVTVPRCYKPKDFRKNIMYSLHHFSDASESGYGQASYLRIENENEDIHCCLIFGKSRVAPLKYVCKYVCSFEVSSQIRVDCCYPFSKNINDTERGTGHSHNFRIVLDR